MTLILWSWLQFPSYTVFDFKRNLMMKVNKSLKEASKQNCSKGKKMVYSMQSWNTWAYYSVWFYLKCCVTGHLTTKSTSFIIIWPIVFFWGGGGEESRAKIGFIHHLPPNVGQSNHMIDRTKTMKHNTKAKNKWSRTLWLNQHWVSLMGYLHLGQIALWGGRGGGRIVHDSQR